ncbi:ABC-type amino acid transport substrate-binding protein [Nitrospirillum amazonense]|uniref:ABC-type amino acid transport substrate-binding protein n=2 Tax=Nitrospirillum amazonense TaxID=28077 RepID=A0A560FSS1_9PROT|nr:ABC-type amino acid transport substrate-binding protein [Nitrospirillum amazonense]
MDRRALLRGAGSAGLGLALGPWAARAAVAPLRFVYADNVVPFSYADADGNATGLLKDDVDVVTSAAGYSQTTSLMPWGRAQATVRAGQADGFCTVPSADRAVYVQFCLQPVMTSDIGIWHRRDDDRFKAVGGLEELAAFRLGSYVGNGWATEHMGAIPTLAVVPDPVSVLKMLAAGRIDAWAAHSDTNLRKLMSGRGRFFIFRNPGLTEVIQNNGWDGRIRILPHPLAVEDQYMVFSRHLDPEVRERLDAGLERLAADGTLERIALRHAGHAPGL